MKDHAQKTQNLNINFKEKNRCWFSKWSIPSQCFNRKIRLFLRRRILVYGPFYIREENHSRIGRQIKQISSFCHQIWSRKSLNLFFWKLCSPWGRPKASNVKSLVKFFEICSFNTKVVSYNSEKGVFAHIKRVFNCVLSPLFLSSVNAPSARKRQWNFAIFPWNEISSSEIYGEINLSFGHICRELAKW